MLTPDSTSRMGRLQNKRVIVTGASGFIGRMVVSICLAEGAAVLAFDKVPFEPIWADSVSMSHAHLVSMLGDITSQTDCTAMVATSVESWGGIDVLINTVGIMEPTDGGPLDTSIDTWDRTMAVNIKGIWLSCAASIPLMLQQGSGSIVNVGSLVGMRGSAIPQIAYTTSKGALIALTRELAVHLAPQNIRVNIVCPGPLEGGLLTEKLTSDKSVRKRTGYIPMGRLGRADEVAQACVYLASDESSFITGIELPVDGGASASFICSELPN
jgi:NAD(P)-dependent dehydrogenase (short-subunit alcohol dehydrogenase family)